MLSATECDACRRMYDRHQTHIFSLLGAQLARRLADLTPADGERPVVADLGCGPGHLSIELARRTGAEVLALDINPAMLALAHTALARAEVADGAPLAVELVHADIHDLPWPDDCVDLAVSYTCAHHWVDPTAALREAARVTRPGGVLVVIDTAVVTAATRSVFDLMHPDPVDQAIVAKAYTESLDLARVAACARAAGLDFELEPHAFAPEDILDCLLEDESFELPELPATPDEPTLWQLTAVCSAAQPLIALTA